MTTRRRRRMDKFRIDEISFVDRPAQADAKAMIAKNVDEGAALASKAMPVLERLHDEAPNSQKSRIAEVIKRAEAVAILKQDQMDTPAFAQMIVDELRARFKNMVEAFVESTGASVSDAEETVSRSEVGKEILRIVDAAEQLSGTQKAEGKESVKKQALQARNQIDDRLDALARERMQKHREDFYTAYETVCDSSLGMDLIKRRDEFHAMAIGTAAHGREIDLSKRGDPEIVCPDLDRSLAAKNADRALIKRAKKLQLERAAQRLNLSQAIAIAKAENPELAKSASI